MICTLIELRRRWRPEDVSGGLHIPMLDLIQVILEKDDQRDLVRRIEEVMEKRQPLLAECASSVAAQENGEVQSLQSWPHIERGATCMALYK